MVCNMKNLLNEMLSKVYRWKRFVRNVLNLIAPEDKECKLKNELSYKEYEMFKLNGCFILLICKFDYTKRCR